MISKNHIEQVLKKNGLDSSLPDDEIKSFLLESRWHPHDIDRALVVLRGGFNGKEQQVETAKQVFNSDQRVNPETLNSILGIDVEINSVTTAHKKSLENAYRLQIISIVITSIVIAALALLIAMWFFKVGFFYSLV